MKIIKTKKVETITEEIEVKDGTYYFGYGYKGDEPYEFYKVIIENRDKSPRYTNITKTKLSNSIDDYQITHSKDFTDYLGVTTEWYFKGEWEQNELEIKEISAEKFEEQKQIVINKLSK